MERRSLRYTVWLPVRVDELSEGMAVGHDASERGMLMVTASTLELGATVTIEMELPTEADAKQTVHGRVVRVEPNLEDPEGMWPHRIAVEFDQPVPALEQTLTRLEGKGLAKKKT